MEDEDAGMAPPKELVTLEQNHIDSLNDM